MTRDTGIVLRNDPEVRAHFTPTHVRAVNWRCDADGKWCSRVILTFPRDGLDALVTEALRRGGS